MPDLRLKSYDPTDVIIVVSWTANGGEYSHIVDGVMNDSFVTVQRSGDAWAEDVGGYGNTTRIYNPVWDKALISINLQNTSQSNDVFDALFARDINAKTSSNLFSISIKDNSGRSLHYGSQAYVAVKPEVAYGTTMQARSWGIRVNRLTDVIAGVSEVESAVATELASLGVTVDPKWISDN